MDDLEARGLIRQTDGLYERYGRPLEAEHWGKYAAIRHDGQTMVEEYYDDLIQRYRKEWGDAPTLIRRVGELTHAPKMRHPHGTPEQQEERRRRREISDGLYERYGKPLEAEHWGKYLAVHPDGRTVLADDYETMSERGRAGLDTGFYIFRIGPRFVHRLPTVRLIPDGSRAIRRAPSSLIKRIAHD